MPWVVDLDGVVWLSGRRIPGAPEAIARLRSAGERVVFVTNNSWYRVADVQARLAAAGVPAEGDVLTSAAAAASLLTPGGTAVVCGGPGVVEALEAVGIRVVEEGPADAVVVGGTGRFDYRMLTVAADAARGGARLVATNDDPTYPTTDGLRPGAGSILAAVATAAGVGSEVAGKPFAPMVALTRRELGDVALTVVGDRASTDGRFARLLGARFALVLSGVTSAADLPTDPEADVVAADLATLVEAELAG